MMLALALFALGALVLLVFPAKYTATSLVVVDPREQRITNEQDVLPGIGQDAAALQSIDRNRQVRRIPAAADREAQGRRTTPRLPAARPTSPSC